MRIKYFLWGGGIALLHFIMVFPLSIYFGLGMSRSGAWFMKNIYMQPGISVQAYLLKSGVLESNYIYLFANIIFYWFIFTFIIYLYANSKITNSNS